MKKKIAILTETNRNSGSGHLKRMKGLFHFIKKKKIDCKFFLLDQNKTLGLIKKYYPNLIICDLKNYNNKTYLSLFKIQICKIINIENYNNSNYDLNISVKDHNKNIIGKRMEGLNFAMVRPELKRNTYKLKKNLIFVNLGSTETINKIKNILLNLKKISKNFKFVVITKFSKYFNNSKYHEKFKFYSSKYFLRYFKSSNINIINGGLTLVEALYLKKKIIVIPQTKYEKKFSNYLKEKTNSINVGIKSINNTSIKKLINEKNRIIIDGYGYERIYRVLNKFYE